MTTQEFFNSLINTITVADILVIFTAILSAIINIYTIRKNTKFQQKWNQKQLDADLTSKARIEWIQKVRDNTAELISIFYKMLKEVSKENLFKELTEAKNRSELLILFFGPEKNPPLIDLSILQNTENNDGKNDMIVLVISRLFDEFAQYYKLASDETLKKLQTLRKAAAYEMYHNPIEKIPLTPSITPDGDIFENFDCVWDKDLQQQVKAYDKEIQDYYNRIVRLERELVKLRDIMRVYLKIEWNKAKAGK